MNKVDAPMLPLFVYGTLRRGERNHPILEPFISCIELAVVSGLQLWDVGPFPMAIEGHGRVHGELITLEPESYAMALARLDLLEGVDPAHPTEPGGFYWRARRSVLLSGCPVRVRDAWVYLGDPHSVAGAHRIVGGDWKMR